MKVMNKNKYFLEMFIDINEPGQRSCLSGAPPGGWRYSGGGFNGIKYYSRYWISTELSLTISYARLLD